MFERPLSLAVVGLVALTGLSLSALSGKAAQSQEEKFEDGIVLVGFQPGIAPASLQVVVQQEGATEIEVVGADTHVLKVEAGQVKAAITALKRHPEVRYAEPNYLSADSEPQPQPGIRQRASAFVQRIEIWYSRFLNLFMAHTAAASSPSGVPNDPEYAKLWAFKNTGQDVNGMKGKPGVDMDAQDAWTVTTGSRDIIVAVLDSGIDYTHPDLQANLWTNPGGIGGCPAGSYGYNAAARSCDPMDSDPRSHGTHVAGIIGAVGNNASGSVGINWTIRIMALKFVENNTATTLDELRALDFALEARSKGEPVRVVNASFHMPAFSQAELDQIERLGDNDILFVASAANGGVDVDAQPVYPAAYGAANEITVAATDQNDELYNNSNYGRHSIHLAAPGVNILSTTRGGGYGYLRGTSMATAQVSGAAALLLAASPLSTAQLKAALLAGVDPVPALKDKTITGGRLNLCKAMAGCSPTGHQGVYLPLWLAGGNAQ